MAKKTLVTITGVNMARTNKQIRTVKMLQPIHADCQWPYRKGWWNDCEAAGHNPYQHEDLQEVETPVFEKDEETGEEVLIKIEQRRVRVLNPNVTQVPLDSGSNDGRGPEKFANDKGFLQLEERGYSPMCQLFDCWLEAKITSPYGEYCSKEHARMIGAREEGVALEVLQPRKRARQLRDIELG